MRAGVEDALIQGSRIRLVLAADAPKDLHDDLLARGGEPARPRLEDAYMEVRNVDVAVLNHDSGNWSREIIRAVQGSPTFHSVTFLRGEEEIRPVIEKQKALFVLVFDDSFSRRADAGAPAQLQVILDGRRSNAAQIAAYYLETIIRSIGEATPMSAPYLSISRPTTG